MTATDAIRAIYGPPLDVISDCLRGFLIAAPGHELIAVDFSAIEARVLAWLAGEEKILEVFRTHGKIYEAAAAGIYGVPLEDVTKDQRQIGKVSILALGFQGGVGAFQKMARAYGIQVPDERADQIKLAWRADRVNTVRYWYALDDAAMLAVSEKGRITEAPKVRFRVSGSFLWCQLPSGRRLCYPYPKIESVETPWGELRDAVTYMGESTMSRKWERQKTFGGKWAENLTQAVARDLLAEAMLRLREFGYKIVMHVHDEVVVEVPHDQGSVDEVAAIASMTPAWAEGLPMAAAGWRGRRYRKE